MKKAIRDNRETKRKSGNNIVDSLKRTGKLGLAFTIALILFMGVAYAADVVFKGGKIGIGITPNYALTLNTSAGSSYGMTIKDIYGAAKVLLNHYSNFKGGSATWTVSSKSDFDAGTYTNTSTNASAVLFLNQTEIHSNYNDSSMVLWLHLNNDSTYGESNTAVYDFSGNGNSGTVSGATWTASGKLGGAYNFDGNDEISMPANFTYTDWSISFWMKSSDADGFFLHTGSGPGSYKPALYTYITGGNNMIDVYGNGDILTISTGIASDTWFHCAITKTTGKITGYVNGVNISGLATYTNVAASNDFFTLGKMRSYGTQTYSGYLDEVGIWNKVLSADEISDLYRRKRGTYMSAIKDAGSSVTWQYLNVTIQENSSLNNITWQVRSCDDSACSGESFVGYDGTANTYFNETSSENDISFLADNQYVQWKAWFERGTGNPQIMDVKIDYNSSAVEQNTSYGFIELNNGSGSTKVSLVADGNSYITSGKVGIGNANPTESLDVSGNVAADDFITKSSYYSGDAVSAIKKIVAENDGSAEDWKKINHSTLGGAEITYSYLLDGKNITFEGQSVDRIIAMLIRANQQLIERIEMLEVQ